MGEVTYKNPDESFWRDASQRTKLMLALQDGKVSKALSIIDEAAENRDLPQFMRAWDIYGNNALMYAVVHAVRPVAARLYVDGADPDGTNFAARSARHLAWKNRERAAPKEKAIFEGILDDFAMPREVLAASITIEGTRLTHVFPRRPHASKAPLDTPHN